MRADSGAVWSRPPEECTSTYWTCVACNEARAVERSSFSAAHSLATHCTPVLFVSFYTESRELCHRHRFEGSRRVFRANRRRDSLAECAEHVWVALGEAGASERARVQIASSHLRAFYGLDAAAHEPEGSASQDLAEVVEAEGQPPLTLRGGGMKSAAFAVTNPVVGSGQGAGAGSPFSRLL